MSTYVIGDVQGCLAELEALLDSVAFDSAHDRLWFVGDLVNRGPDSLGVLRFVKALGNSALCVLGNHDLFLLKLACGPKAQRRDHPSLLPFFKAHDRNRLIEWLSSRPLFHHEGDNAMVHAGLLPSWTAHKAQALAKEVQTALSGPESGRCLGELWGNRPIRWDDELQGFDRLRVITNAMTRLRFCNLDGAMDFSAKGPPQKAPPGCTPWFLMPNRAHADVCVCFGHWSALGVYQSQDRRVIGLDSGCVWGESLTALRLEDKACFSVPSYQAKRR
jgi:bis(5'-nucleosyl)-tetraphosphatase (symmetrical)